MLDLYRIGLTALARSGCLVSSMKLNLNDILKVPTDAFTKPLDQKLVDSWRSEKKDKKSRKRKKSGRRRKFKNGLGPDEAVRDFFFFTRGI